MADHIFDTDPIREWEELTGKDYKQNSEEDNKSLMGHFFAHNTVKNQLVTESGDTTFSMSGEDYQKNIEDFGFELIYQEDFTAESFGEVKQDTLKVFWLDGILLYFDTYAGQRNGGNFWYNWVQESADLDYKVLSSGRYVTFDMKPDFSGELEFSEPEPEMDWDKYDWHQRLSKFRLDNNLQRIWVGYHDCRELMRRNITRLRQHGRILSKWMYPQSCLRITHYGEKDELYGSRSELPTIRTNERIAKFPKHVQDSLMLQDV